jgi:hypothetical protein
LKPPGSSAAAAEPATLFVGDSKQQQQGGEEEEEEDVLSLAFKLLDGGKPGSSGSNGKSGSNGAAAAARIGSNGSRRGGPGPTPPSIVTPGSSSSSSSGYSSRSSATAATATATALAEPPAVVAAPLRQKAAVVRRTLSLCAGGVSLPHPSKAKTGGEDAFFVSAAGCGALGVADGVGSWSADGIDPAAYAIGLMDAAQQALEESRGKRSALDALDFAQVGQAWGRVV